MFDTVKPALSSLSRDMVRWSWKPSGCFTQVILILKGTFWITKFWTFIARWCITRFDCIPGVGPVPRSDGVGDSQVLWDPAWYDRGGNQGENRISHTVPYSARQEQTGVSAEVLESLVVWTYMGGLIYIMCQKWTSGIISHYLKIISANNKVFV